MYPNLVFTTDVETLSYYENGIDLCALCHRYQKRVDFFGPPSDGSCNYLQRERYARATKDQRFPSDNTMV